MNDDTICVVFCNPKDALEFLEDGEMGDNMVLSKVIPEGEVTLVPKDEFLEWLRGKKEGEGGEDGIETVSVLRK